MKRIYELDYLRGLMAVFIMIYHNMIWLGAEFSADDVMSRIGLYGVSVFYVLSGLTLFLVYENADLFEFKSLVRFYLKRIFRIYPLLILVVLLAASLKHNNLSLKYILFNVTGLFGFIKPSSYISTGLWSIGNELVFYAFFPIIMISFRRRVGFVITLFIALFLLIYFSFFSFNQEGSITENWKAYVNPFNQIYLFISGMAIGYLLSKRLKTNLLDNNNLVFLILLTLVAIFMFYPVSGETNNLIIGWHRVVFIFIAVTFCWLVLLIKSERKGYIHRIFIGFGDMSYSIYLLHPIVYLVIIKVLKPQSFSLSWGLLSMSATILLSYIIYTFYEKKFIGVGNKLISSFLS